MNALRTGNAVSGALSRSACSLVTLVLSGAVMAQSSPYRENQEAVLVPPRTEAHQPPPDEVQPFKNAYERVGEPKIMLFWNVALDDQTQTQREKRELTTKTGTQSSTGLDKQTQGPAGEATLTEHDDKHQETIETVTRERTVDAAKAENRLSARNAVELEVAFREELEAAGTHLVSRSTGIRFTQSTLDRSGVDPKLIEADAVREHAEYLLEIVMVPDPDATINAGFKVTLTDTRSATEVLTRYTQASVHRAPELLRTVVTDTGFERRAMPSPRITVTDVGIELAHEVMNWLGSSFMETDRRTGSKITK